MTHLNDSFAHLGAGGHEALIPILLGKLALDRSCRVLARETVIEVLQKTCDYGVVVAHNQPDSGLIAVENFFHIRPPFARGAVG